MTGTENHPEQDPAEGSRGKVENQLRKQPKRQANDSSEDKKHSEEKAGRTRKDAS